MKRSIVSLVISILLYSCTANFHSAVKEWHKSQEAKKFNKTVVEADSCLRFKELLRAALALGGFCSDVPNALSDRGESPILYIMPFTMGPGDRDSGNEVDLFRHYAAYPSHKLCQKIAVSMSIPEDCSSRAAYFGSLKEAAFQGDAKEEEAFLDSLRRGRCPLNAMDACAEGRRGDERVVEGASIVVEASREYVSATRSSLLSDEAEGIAQGRARLCAAFRFAMQPSRSSSEESDAAKSMFIQELEDFENSKGKRQSIRDAYMTFKSSSKCLSIVTSLSMIGVTCNFRLLRGYDRILDEFPRAIAVWGDDRGSRYASAGVSIVPSFALWISYLRSSQLSEPPDPCDRLALWDGEKMLRYAAGVPEILGFNSSGIDVDKSLLRVGVRFHARFIASKSDESRIRGLLKKAFRDIEQQEIAAMASTLGGLDIRKSQRTRAVAFRAAWSEASQNETSSTNNRNKRRKKTQNPSVKRHQLPSSINIWIMFAVIIGFIGLSPLVLKWATGNPTEHISEEHEVSLHAQDFRRERSRRAAEAREQAGLNNAAARDPTEAFFRGLEAMKGERIQEAVEALAEAASLSQDPANSHPEADLHLGTSKRLLLLAKARSAYAARLDWSPNQFRRTLFVLEDRLDQEEETPSEDADNRIVEATRLVIMLGFNQFENVQRQAADILRSQAAPAEAPATADQAVEELAEQTLQWLVSESAAGGNSANFLMGVCRHCSGKSPNQCPGSEIPPPQFRQTDRLYAGIAKLQCSKGCQISYHPSCWKTVARDMERRKDYACPNNDCGQPLAFVSLESANGEITTKPAGRRTTNKAKDASRGRQRLPNFQRQHQRRNQSTPSIATASRSPSPSLGSAFRSSSSESSSPEEPARERDQEAEPAQEVVQLPADLPATRLRRSSLPSELEELGLPLLKKPSKKKKSSRARQPNPEKLSLGFKSSFKDCPTPGTQRYQWQLGESSKSSDENARVLPAPGENVSFDEWLSELVSFAVVQAPSEAIPPTSPSVRKLLDDHPAVGRYFHDLGLDPAHPPDLLKLLMLVAEARPNLRLAIHFEVKDEGFLVEADVDGSGKRASPALVRAEAKLTGVLLRAVQRGHTLPDGQVIPAQPDCGIHELRELIRRVRSETLLAKDKLVPLVFLTHKAREDNNPQFPHKNRQETSQRNFAKAGVTIQVHEGERALTKDNHRLGTLELSGIPPAPRGVPQIEVSFDVDANGILLVKALDKASGKSGQIHITNEKGRLSQAEIQRMVEEAEQFAAEDDKERERIASRNSLEAYAFQVKASLDSAPASLEGRDAALSACQDALQWLDANSLADKEELEDRKRSLEEVCRPVMTRMHQGAPTTGPTVEEMD